MAVPTDAQFFSSTDRTKPDIAFLKNHFYREGRVTEEQALYILQKGTELLKKEPNLLEVDAPITGTTDSFITCTCSNSCFHSLWRHPWSIRMSIDSYMPCV